VSPLFIRGGEAKGFLKSENFHFIFFFDDEGYVKG
jgi:hypothetical protein